MTEHTDVKPSRRPYRRPEWEQVQLIAEEAVLLGCKLAGAGTPGPQGKNTPCQQQSGTGYCLVQLS